MGGRVQAALYQLARTLPDDHPPASSWRLLQRLSAPNLKEPHSP